jgi:hypothetical protein
MSEQALPVMQRDLSLSHSSTSQNLEIANGFTNHPAIKIAALEWQHKLADLFWQRGADHEGMLEIPAASELAMEICCSVEYHLQPAHVHTGAFYMLMPARIAYYAIPKWSREARWLAIVLRDAADTSGFELARNVLDNIPIRQRKLVEDEDVQKDSPATSESVKGVMTPYKTRKSEGG